MFWKFNFGGKQFVPSSELIKKMYLSINKDIVYPGEEASPLPSVATDVQLSKASSTQRREYARRNPNNFKAMVTMFGPTLVEDIDFQTVSLKLLLNNSTADEIDIETFGHFVGLLGPFDKNLIERVSALIKTNWFHGNLSKTEAEGRLRNENPGTYLVRFSANNPGCYVISKVATDRSPKHILIAHNKDGSFSTKTKDPKNYPSFEALLKGEGKTNNLLSECPNSVFKNLFVAVNPYQETD